MTAEAVGIEYLLPAYHLNKYQILQLHELGWKEPDGSGNYSQEILVRDDTERLEVVNLVIKTAESIYGIVLSHKIKIELNLE